LKLKIKNGQELKSKLEIFSDKINFNELAEDVEPFLFNAKDSKKVILFAKYIKNLEL